MPEIPDFDLIALRLVAQNTALAQVAIVEQLRQVWNARGAALTRWEALARSGFIVSVCCGPCGEERPFRWSVDVLAPDGQEFDQPFAAESFEHAIAIADM
jgi:hypothetical protein